MPTDDHTQRGRPRIHQEDIRFRSLRTGTRRSGAPRRGDEVHNDPPILASTIYSPADAVPTRAPGGPSLPGLIVGHGAGSNRRRHAGFATAACAAGMVVMTIDFRGHGESTGSLDGPLELDVLAAAAILRSHPLVNRNRVCYRGSSMGGFYGLRAAPDVGFAALALLCPADERVLLPGLADSTDRGRTLRQGPRGPHRCRQPARLSGVVRFSRRCRRRRRPGAACARPGRRSGAVRAFADTGGSARRANRRRHPRRWRSRLGPGVSRDPRSRHTMVDRTHRRQAGPPDLTNALP